MVNGTEVSVQAIIEKLSAHNARLIQKLAVMEVQCDTLLGQVEKSQAKVAELEGELERLKPEAKEPKVAKEKDKK